MQAAVTAAEILQVTKRYQGDYAAFFREILGVELEDYQEKILAEIAAHDRIAISACHDVGKSWTLARVVLCFGTIFPYCKIVTTAPTGRQVEKILWSEIRSAYARSKVPLGGRMLTTEWKITEEEDWFAFGFSPRNEAIGGEGQGAQSSFQGFHAEGGVLVIFDEATGVKPGIWTMAEGLLTQDNVKFVCIGNPTDAQSEFAKCFKNRAWHKIKLNCFDSPNLKANGVVNMEVLKCEVEYCRTLDDEAFSRRMKSYKVVKGYLLTLRWVVEKALDWGFDHPLFLSKVLGEFPEEGENVAIPLRTVEQAQLRTYEPKEGDRRIIGVDVARFGSDSTVLTYLHGFSFVAKKVLTKKDTNEVAGEVIAFAAAYGMPDIIVIDETGIGGGVVDVLSERRDEGGGIKESVEVRGVQFGEGFDAERQPKEKERYVNVKARMVDLLAKDLKGDLCLPDEDVYLEELPMIQYRYDSKGRMYIESKDEFKKRTGRGSPDHADSLALANFGRYDEIPVGRFSETFTAKRTNTQARPRSWSRKGKAAW